MVVRRGIEITGLVQGVGFRPYIYRLAVQRHLRGSVRNSPAGASIEVQGPAEAVDDFVARLRAEAPPLVQITSVSVCELPCCLETEFRICPSEVGAEARVLVSPDVAVCGDCLRELFDPTDRRYRYPFINCTNCGPRFTIVRDIPYDRARTSMAVFPMCSLCRAEYNDPLNRRFHAQPNACRDCGPQLQLWDSEGRPVQTEDPIRTVQKLLHGGAVVALKGLGGFHLAVDATQPDAVACLRERKRRVEKPFAIMAPDLETIEQFCQLDDSARQALSGFQRPIMLLPKKFPNPVADGVAPRNRFFGVFLPYTPLHHLLFADRHFLALVMTSGNRSEEPIAIGNQEALAALGQLADYFLVHNRDILRRCDDSVVRVVATRVQQLRRSRGYVPVPVFLRWELPPVLAVGGELKNTVCLTRGRAAFLSQHVGDLENLEAYRFFEEAIEHLQRILQVTPRIIAYDLHPDYLATRWAQERTGIERIGIQHHHAHIAACMAENHLDGRVIGIALDGTGYGTDGRIWGGEILTADYAGFTRAAHLAYVHLPGGVAAIREPWRMAVSYLWQHFGRKFLATPIPLLDRMPARDVEFVVRMLERGVNSPLTSSCGRLFDGVAALIGVTDRISYEAQAAVELEMCLEPGPAAGAYPFAVVAENSCLQIDTRPMFEALLDDLRMNMPAGVMSCRFHNGLVAVLASVAEQLRRRVGLNRVCLSGGCFQNAYLAEHLEEKLQENGFQVFTHTVVPPGDGGLSLGQAMIAAHRLQQQPT